ncbi:MAG: prenyltransferase [Candidatus Omnitrophica bacterium]|nr:prenyltransferase [Candidatus Omnitrophota bacterium]
MNKTAFMFLLKEIKTWIALSRPPFQVVGVLPFIVGSLLPLKTVQALDVPVFLWGLFGVVLVMLSTYFNGEVHDIQEDRLSVKLEKNIFSAGTQVLVQGLIAPQKVKGASYGVIGTALLVAVILQFCYKTGPWTIPLGISGIITGFYYSKPPFRWVQKGLGEIFIGYSYGWLPVAAGAYLQTGHIDSIVHWVSLPIICSVFNVILINEFPDYPADIQVNKRNLVVRFGKERCAVIYAVMALAGGGTFFVSLTQGVPAASLFIYLPVGVLSCASAGMMLAKKFNHRKLLERMCLITYLVNLGTCFSYIAGFVIPR